MSFMSNYLLGTGYEFIQAMYQCIQLPIEFMSLHNYKYTILCLTWLPCAFWFCHLSQHYVCLAALSLLSNILLFPLDSGFSSHVPVMLSFL